jgi:hypothetical protein
VIQHGDGVGSLHPRGVTDAAGEHSHGVCVSCINTMGEMLSPFRTQFETKEVCRGQAGFPYPGWCYHVAGTAVTATEVVEGDHVAVRVPGPDAPGLVLLG